VNEPVSFLSMFLLGLLGTGHCVGMCGPLVLALPARSGQLWPQLLYHLGRVTTYSALGAALGAAGQGLGALALTSKMQLGLSILAAGLLLMFGLARLGLIREPALLSVADPGRIPGISSLRRLAGGDRPGLAYLPLGLALGLLPCGLSYAALARALPAGSWITGAALLGAFGLGTLPGLLLLGTAAAGLARRHRRVFDLLAGVLLVGMAAALLADLLAAL